MEPDRLERLLQGLTGKDDWPELNRTNELKELGDKLPNHLLCQYRRSPKAENRCACVFYAIPYAKRIEAAYTLGLEALTDRSRIVRYRACMLVAFALRREALPTLRELLNHQDLKTVEDARAAIYAIENQNHNYFVDRKHRGKIKLNIIEA